ncbi:MAG: hypothetical protein K0R87_3522, partial [Pseudonocardia sp.]|nr:hypothetical protein [Pseudonocardia sp.]
GAVTMTAGSHPLAHDEIYARVQQGPGRASSADAEAAWSTVESTIRAVDEQLTRAVRQIGVSWEGAAADRVHGGMTVMSCWALDAAGDALLTRNGIAAQADEAAFVRTHMPPPRTAEWNQTMGQVLAADGFVPAIADLGALEDRMANDHARAVELMNQYSIRSVDNQKLMNYWTPPPTVVVEAVAPGAQPAQVGTGTAASHGAMPGGMTAPAVDASATAPGPGAVAAPPVVRAVPHGQAAPPGRTVPGAAVRPSSPVPTPGGGARAGPTIDRRRPSGLDHRARTGRWGPIRRARAAHAFPAHRARRPAPRRCTAGDRGRARSRARPRRRATARRARASAGRGRRRAWCDRRPGYACAQRARADSDGLRLPPPRRRRPPRRPRTPPSGLPPRRHRCVRRRPLVPPSRHQR